MSIEHAHAIGAFRAAVARRYRSWLRRGKPLPIRAGQRIAVFAPHPDDETLGCGGAIALGRRAGAKVSIIIMTDGRRSHRHLMPEPEIARMRSNEAYLAAETLGVERQDLVLLDYADGALAFHRPAALAAVRQLLLDRRPDLILLPTRLEEPEDHYSTFEIVMAAVRDTGCKADLFEYPVWFWMQWPFVPLALPSRSDLPRQLLATARSGWRLLREFNHCCILADTIETKRAALNQYASQMTRIVPTARWQTLGDVADGAFLDCLLQPMEVFRRAAPQGHPPR
jgi:LmbE family N-acetylglucosaminyl deacetylase